MGYVEYLSHDYVGGHKDEATATTVCPICRSSSRRFKLPELSEDEAL
jgi:hypothetical protein